jgi:hypothetical protein
MFISQLKKVIFVKEYYLLKRSFKRIQSGESRELIKELLIDIEVIPQLNFICMILLFI